MRLGAICYLDEVVEARKDTTVVIHPLCDDRRILPIDKRGELLQVPPEFCLVISYNPGYQSVLKEIKPSTRQRFVALDFDYPAPEVEAEIVASEGGIDGDIARRLVASGDLVTPWFDDGVPFWAKPPLSFWLTAGSFEVLTTTGKYYWIPTERVATVEFHPPKRPRDLLWRRATMSVPPPGAKGITQRIGLVGVLVFVADQVTKFAVLQLLGYQQERVVVDGFFKFVHWGNTGAAWSMFHNSNALLTVIALLALLALFLTRHHFGLEHRLGQWALGLMFGGIVGNIIDRLVHHHVVDFLYFHVQTRSGNEAGFPA